MTESPTESPKDSRLSFLKSNQGLLYMALVLAIPAFIVSLVIGLNPGFTTACMLLFIGVAYAIHRWRARRSSEPANSPGSLSITGVLAAVAVLVLIQAVPYGRSHSNGAIVAEPKWPNDQTRSLVVRACYDCHSNEVKYPAYANVAPISWLVENHVDEGRSAVNFSDINNSGRGAREVVEVIEEGSMPPGYFTRFGLHKTAKLSKAETATLIASLKTMPEFQGRG